jgi:hypothetical protein
MGVERLGRIDPRWPVRPRGCILLLLGKGLLIAALMLSMRSLNAQAATPNPGSLCPYSTLLRTIYRTVVPAAYGNIVERIRIGFFFLPQADGGSDGTGDSSGADTGTDGAGPGSDGDPDPDPSSVTDNAVGVNDAPTDPFAPINTVDFATQQSHDAVANPFGGVPGPVFLSNGTDAGVGAEPVPGAPAGPGSPGGTDAFPPPPTANTPSPPRAQIHAVIVSSLSDPSQVLRGSVNLTGGIVALGSANSSTPQKAGRWDPNVKITPDPELLNGHKIPPLVPNVIDVRIMHHEVSATIESEGSISGQP